MHSALYIDGKWVSGRSNVVRSVNPATDEIVWEAMSGDTMEIHNAVEAAGKAFHDWRLLGFDKRLEYLEKYNEGLKKERKNLAKLISQETGKPLWESLTEVDAMIGKLGISVTAYDDRCSEKTNDIAGARSVTRFRPHGTIAVFGPFNLPGHLPNGHIVPALLAGNTIVFKSSEMTPAVSEFMFKLFEAAELPPGVVNLIQGAKDTGAALAQNPQINGLYFTGSYATGQILHKGFAGQPEKILVLEMGGNNPLIVHNVDDLKAAAYTTIQSAYITSGQRCVCARRLIVPEGKDGDKFIDELVGMIGGISAGVWSDDPEPFMGPLISRQAADGIMGTYKKMLSSGGKEIVPMTQSEDTPALLTPALVDASAMKYKDDTEHFGPLLRLLRVKDFDAAVREANSTTYGLSAGLLSDSESDYNHFLNESNAGIINWNMQITGASSAAPFGGTGHSGNHRPGAYFAADYCAYPTASMEKEKLCMPEKTTAGIEIK